MADELYRVGRWNGEEPTKPPSARAIAQLGIALDRAEWFRNQLTDGYWKPGDDGSVSRERAGIIAREDAILDRFRDALSAYIDAVNARDLCARVKFIRQTKTPRAQDAFPLQDAFYSAWARADYLRDLGEEFSSRRERVDADCARAQAQTIYRIAEAKFQDAELFERRTGISKLPRSRRRIVTDGYVTTGKYKMIDGQRVPVLEKVS